VAANALGARRLQEVAAKYGTDALEANIEWLYEYTERRAREDLKAIPSGVYRAEGFLDDDGITDEPVRLVVTVSVQDSEIVFDLTGSDEQRRAPTNATYSMSFSGLAYVVKCLVSPDIPVNDGFYRLVKVVAPPGTVVNCQHPAGVVAGWEIAMRLCETAFLALAAGIPDRVIAGTKGCICNIAFGGMRPEGGGYYAYYETIAGGYGARATKDGMDAVQPHVHNTENAPVEEIEANYPVHIRRLELIPDSEGPGRFRGGLGVRRDYWFRDHRASFSVLSDRAKFAPWGLFGGGEGRRAHYVRDPEGKAEGLGSKRTVELEVGEVVSVQTPGGGGRGDPLERDPQAVLADVRDGKVSLERARRIYGVIIQPASMELDVIATQNLRKARNGKGARGEGR